MQRAKVRRNVPRIAFGHAEIRHRRERTDRLWVAQPLDHVLRRVRQETGQILSARDAVERRTDKGIGAGDTRYEVARLAPVLSDGDPASFRVATGRAGCL